MFMAFQLIGCLFFGENSTIMNSNNMINVSQQVPSYAKWGK